MPSGPMSNRRPLSKKSNEQTPYVQKFKRADVSRFRYKKTRCFQPFHMLLMFEPITGALVAHALEYATASICSARRRCPTLGARLWLRRNSEHVLDALVTEELPEVVLDVSSMVVHTDAVVSALVAFAIIGFILQLKIVWMHRRWHDGR